MWVITTEDKRCIVKGKAAKSLVGLEEDTKKELVGYQTAQRAHSAIMRMRPEPSRYAAQLYGDGAPRLVATPWSELEG